METRQALPTKAEAWWALGYFIAYMAYHTAIGGESDAWHWAGLVLVPFAGLLALHGSLVSPRRWPATIRSMGLRRENLRTGVLTAALLGLGISILQSMNRMDEIVEIVVSGRVLYLYPAVLLLLLLTAGFTEEWFFRGILQTRLQRSTGSSVQAVLITSVLFSIYHIPYTYLNPNWPSAGDPGAALQAAFVNGMLGGVVLGVLYVKTKNNLVSTITLHSLINSVPAMTMIQFNVG